VSKYLIHSPDGSNVYASQWLTGNTKNTSYKYIIFWGVSGDKVGVGD